MAERIATHEAKARWCEEMGLHADAAEHRAYVAQLRRQAAAFPAPAENDEK